MHLEDITKNLPALIAALLVAILFIQSGLDKVFDWKGNLEWLKGHFAKTFVAGLVPIMLAKITVLEIATGVASAAGIVYFMLYGSTLVIFWAAALGALTVTALFFWPTNSKGLPWSGSPYSILYFVDNLDDADASGSANAFTRYALAVISCALLWPA